MPAVLVLLSVVRHPIVLREVGKIWERTGRLSIDLTLTLRYLYCYLDIIVMIFIVSLPVLVVRARKFREGRQRRLFLGQDLP